MRLLTLFILLPLVSTPARADELTVSAAISLKDALTRIAADYAAEHGTVVKLHFGSSGPLASQIRNGAKVDLFISAADRQVSDLAEAGLIDEARTIVATNRLVLVVPKDDENSVKRFTDLASPALKRLAIGQPRTVPAGDYAQHALDHLKLSPALKGRLVHATNVRQVLDYVERGEVTAGIVYATDARGSNAVRVIAEADPAWHPPIVYPAAIIKATRNRERARHFLAYLTSDSARRTLERNGFSLPEHPPAARP